MDNYSTIVAGYMHPSKRQLVSYNADTNTGILYTSPWTPVALFKVSKGKDVFLEAFEACSDSTNMVTLKNVIDYAETNIDRQKFRVGPYDGMYEYPWQPFVLRIATLTVSEYEAFCY